MEQKSHQEFVRMIDQNMVSTIVFFLLFIDVILFVIFIFPGVPLADNSA